MCWFPRSSVHPHRGGSEMRRHWFALLAVSLLVVSACSTRPSTHDMSHAQAPSADRPVLYDSLGSYSYRITTKSPEAQRWFDQGLRLVYAFNHHEAQRAFREATRLDPGCAMGFWGIAMTEGSNYNSPTDTDREKRALDAVHAAQGRAAAAT